MRSDPRDPQVRRALLVQPGRKVRRVRKGLSGRKGPRVQGARPVRLDRRALSGRKVPRGKPDRKVPSDPPASAAILVRRARRDRPAQPGRPAHKARLALLRRFASSPDPRRSPATTPNNWCPWSARAARPMASSVPPVQLPLVCACGNSGYAARYEDGLVDEVVSAL